MGVSGWIAVDWIVAGYTMAVAIVALVSADAIPWAPYIVLSHVALVGAMLALPPRGAAWETARSGDSAWMRRLRATGRFLRHTYPALLLTPFFEEVALTVNAAAPESPFWFERFLVEADRTLFGGAPAAMLARAEIPLLDEIMHALYFSYYVLIIGGIVLAWRGRRQPAATPAPGFDRAFTCMMLGFFLSYIWYPFIPARGPWEHPEIVGDLRQFDGWVFTPLIELIIAGAAVSGGCFPSAHVSGTWAMTFGLYPFHRRAAWWFGVTAVGLSIATVYTRYHHAVDVFAGLAVAIVAAAIGHRLGRDRT